VTDPVIQEFSARFLIGELIIHKRFDYRGVISDIDPVFNLSEEWYETVARSRPPKDQPWYQVLVHQSGLLTYVAEQHLQSDPSDEAIQHPMISEFFSGFHNGRYIQENPLH
jgi:heat shock protein HspQ